ncbi:glycine zipper domain-containing protein [Thermococcus sp.]|uniref:glycine zipper domain-containing protein n=1 Tax=Thermococcus sp. TaxID=35749 RepID=UPI00261EEF57|nr:glycine zipper domain-containing protein [Thermococcus sp.]
MLSFFDFLRMNKREGREDEDEERRRKPHRRDRRKSLTSVFIMLLLLVSVAEPVAASSWFEPNWEAIGNFVDTVQNNVLGGAVGAFAGAKIGATVGSAFGPVGTAVGAVVGAIGGYILGSHAEQDLKDAVGKFLDPLKKLLYPPKPKIPGNFQQHKNVTKQDFENNTAVISALASNLTKEADAAAIKDLQILQAKVHSELTTYSFDESNGTGDFAEFKLYGPESIYGFSAFPVKFELAPRGTKDVKDPICLTSVRIYVKDTVTGDIKWTRTWTYGKDKECIDPGDESFVWTFKTILKGPDDNLGDLMSIMYGNANNATIAKLFSAKPDKFEIVIEVDGYRKIYYYADGEWHFDHDEPIHAYWQSLSAWKHIGGGTYPLGGFGGSLPVDAKNTPEAMQFTRYNILFAGAASNLLTVVYGNPINILDATTNFKFVFQGNPGYFDPLHPAIIDEARIVVYRVLKDGRWELAESQPVDGPATLGDIASGKKLYISVTYHNAPDVVTYRAFLALKAEVERDDGTKIPIWILIEPNIAVIPPNRVVTLDPYITEIGDIVSDKVITAEEATKLKTMSKTIIEGLKSKIKDAEAWKAKGDAEGKKDVSNYASLAIKHYNKAIEYAEKMGSTDDSNDLLRFAEIEKEEEMAGDYYLQAAQAAYYGQTEQAKALAENAKKLDENAKQYEGGFLPGVLPDLSDWKSVLAFILRIGLAIAGIYIAKKLFGTVGALIAAGLAFVFVFGPAIGVSL